MFGIYWSLKSFFLFFINVYVNYNICYNVFFEWISLDIIIIGIGNRGSMVKNSFILIVKFG